ncbi:MAG: hypothetical protein HGA51_05425 [Demequinaceae bacterium]|nr:hypothetical protein [Demequinaceae bacterium]
MADVSERTIGDPLSSAALADLATVAQQTGKPLEATIARIGWQEDFAILVSSLRSKFPDDFAGAAIEKDGNPWVSFGGNVPANASSMISDFDRIVFGQDSLSRSDGSGYRVELRTGKGFSEKELDERLAAVHYAILDQSDIVATASSGYDQDTGLITVRVQPTKSYAEATGAEFTSLLETRGLGVGDDVEIVIVDGIQEAEDTIYGGQAMSTCTSGFTVILRATTRGVATAAHCPDSQSQGGYTLTFVSEHQGNWGDVQWHTSGSTEADDFYAGSTTTWGTDLRDVGSRGSAVTGQTLCRNGITTFKNCDEVYELNHCSGNVCHLTAMEHDWASGGDSGGPWYWANTAYGLHRGNKWWAFAYHDTFTPQQNIGNAISGLVIATT